MDRVAGSLGAAPIWKALMEKFLAGTPKEEFNPPDGVVRLACSGSKEASSAAEYYIQGAEPKGCIDPKLASSSPVPTPSPAPQVSSEGERDNQKKDKKAKDDD